MCRSRLDLWPPMIEQSDRDSFRAVFLERTPAGTTAASVRDLEDAAVPHDVEDTVVVDIAYSSLNYKDALAITGTSPVVRSFPMVAGIDFAGTVRESADERWRVGDDVVLTGWHASETHWGGLAQRARVPATWLVRKPATLTLFETMALGTAGFTAALCLLAFEKHGVVSGSGDVLVTGATGGVGSLAIMLLAASGYRVVASTGKLHEATVLRQLGASEVIDRATLATPGKPLQAQRWVAAVDTVGSHTLANICASTHINGIVTACGLAQGMDLPTTVAPFILRGVTLAGINSVFPPPETRLQAWDRLDRLVDRQQLRRLSREISLSDVIETVPKFLSGEVSGRIVVNVNAN
jgi:acrylyl-CoA reductase (NADPH)